MTEEDLVNDVQTVCDVVRTTLGPFGANKLLIQEGGAVTATTSSTELLDRLDIANPAVTLLETAANGFGEQYGDGTGTVVTLAGVLLEEANTLLELGLHPTAIERGYREALDVALNAVELSAQPLSSFGPAAVARTALTGTRNPQVRRAVANQVARAVEAIGPRRDSDVQIVSHTGGTTAETDLVRGVVLDRSSVLDAMPRSADGGIAVLSSSVDVPHVGSQTGRVTQRIIYEVDSFEDREAIAEFESETFDKHLQGALDAGCRAIITERAINERVQTELAARGILGIQRVDRDELERIARATGATVISSLTQVTELTLGSGVVDIQRKAGRDMTVITSEAGEAIFTLFCRAPDPRSVTAFEGSIEAAIAATAAAIRDDRVVPGGGAIEATVASVVEEESRSFEGRHQLAAERFGRALLVIPRTLATTAGMNGGQTVIRLRVARSEGRNTIGVDTLVGKTVDVLGSDPIVEPISLKQSVLSAASDLAIQLVRIDDCLPATDLVGTEMTPPDDNDMEEI